MRQIIPLLVIGMAIAMTGCFVYLGRTKAISEAAANDHEARVVRRRSLKTVAGVYVFWSCVIFLLAVLFGDAAGIIFAAVALLVAFLLLVRLALLR